MDSSTYKAITSAPGCMRRSALIDAAAVLRDIDNRLAGLVLGQAQKTPVETPDAHKGESHDAFIQLELSESEADEVIAALFTAEAGAIGIDGSTTLLASSIGSLVDQWQRYVSHRAP